jgi:CheY-like chemotaxis protein
VAAPKTILLVSPTVAMAESMVRAISARGYHTVCIDNFREAKRFLAGGAHVDLLVTELKLGDFNGLHLAVRAGALDVPAVVIAEGTFASEVEHLGATWLSVHAALSDDIARVVFDLTSGTPGPESFPWHSPATESANFLAPAATSSLLH